MSGVPSSDDEPSSEEAAGKREVRLVLQANARIHEAGMKSREVIKAWRQQMAEERLQVTQAGQGVTKATDKDLINALGRLSQRPKGVSDIYKDPQLAAIITKALSLAGRREKTKSHASILILERKSQVSAEPTENERYHHGPIIIHLLFT
ncbi:MAG: hypothetical protein Q9219_005569 [cf. Caloplaca sp. 3 TL-2023]